MAVPLERSQIIHKKIVLLGDTAVGKSCIVVRYVRDEFDEFQEPTIGAAFLAKLVNVEDKLVKLEIWDTAGQERYHSLASMYYRDAVAAILVFDITNMDSFKSAKRWLNELKMRGSPDVIVVLAGNKSDLSARREVSAEDAKSFAEENLCLYFEVSAKENKGIGEMFDKIAQTLPKDSLAPSETAFPKLPEKADEEDFPCC